MSSLKERPLRFEDVTSLDHLTKERIERLSSYLLEPASASIHDDSDSRLTTSAGADERSPATSRSNGGSIMASAVRYIATTVLSCAAGFTFIMLIHQARQTASQPNSAPVDQATAAMTVAVSSPAISDDTLYAGEPAELQLSMPGGESWQKTVGNLTLLTKQKASKAASQSENERVLAQLEAWQKAKAQ